MWQKKLCICDWSNGPQDYYFKGNNYGLPDWAQSNHNVLKEDKLSGYGLGERETTIEERS